MIWTLEYKLDGQGSIPGNGSEGIFFLAIMSRPALGPIQPPIWQSPVALLLGLKKPSCEFDHSHPSSVNVKNAWNDTSTHPHIFTAKYSVKHSNLFYLNMTLTT